MPRTAWSSACGSAPNGIIVHCKTKGRRHPEHREALTTAFRLRERLSIEIVAVSYDEVINVARAANLTAYDASYLWLARKLGAELVTLDRRLASASASL